MKKLMFILLIISIIGCHSKTTSLLSPSTEEINSTLAKNYTFPQDWLGEWTGQLNIYDSLGLKNQIPMALNLSKTDTAGIFNWTIIYGSDSTAQKREYLLKEIDAPAGHYIIDEKNGILLDAFLFNNELVSIFEVMSNTLIITYARKSDNLNFSVKVFPSESIRSSGNTIHNNQEIPAVNSFHLKSTQVAILNKKCLVE